jgi:hypothetical protein
LFGSSALLVLGLPALAVIFGLRDLFYMKINLELLILQLLVLGLPALAVIFGILLTK